jgi:hypothetical protein
MRVRRLLDSPLITAATHPSIGVNIQGPSLIRVPEWVRAPLGRYYLYFADHKGRYIRLAYADDLRGPWSVHPPGSLRLEESHFPDQPPAIDPEARRQLAAFGAAAHPARDLVDEAPAPHVASPDVHVCADTRTIVMYFHGLEGLGVQVTRVATSADGLRFDAQPQALAGPYLRAFAHAGQIYAMTMPGRFHRSADGFGRFEDGPRLFNPDMRHAALLKRGETLYVFWTQVGHTPERILLSTIDLAGDWRRWSASPPVEVLRPEHPWEGADAPLEPSLRGLAHGHVNQLRDPAIYVENGRTYLLYAVAGETGIALAEVVFPD